MLASAATPTSDTSLRSHQARFPRRGLQRACRGQMPARYPPPVTLPPTSRHRHAAVAKQSPESFVCVCGVLASFPVPVRLHTTMRCIARSGS